MRGNFKKIMALVTALVMMLAVMSVSAFAEDGDTPAVPVKNDSITVTGTKTGETYSLYKMFDLKVDSETNPTAYSYTITDSWKAFFTGEGASYITVSDTGYVTAISDAAALAKEAAAYVKTKTLTALTSKEAAGETVVFSGLEDGYYLITSTLGTVAMTETTPDKTAVTVNEKNPADTIEKTVKEDSTGTYGKNNDAEVGQLVEFKSVATLNTHTRNVFIHDTMDSGLTFSGNDSIHIYTDEACTTALDPANYTVLATPQTGDTFTIQIADIYADSVAAGTKLYITYTATLNENAVVKGTDGTAIVDQNNKTKITYGDKQSVEDQTVTTTHKFSVYKHAKGATDNLAGAIFKVKKADGTAVRLIKLDDNNYRVAKENETGAVETFTTVASGDIVIWGVDSDSYKLEETAAPSGYNKLTSDVDVTVDAANSTREDVENVSGSTLPSTGGMGTTFFYIVGAVLVIAAGALLVFKKRFSVR